jgi:hypothetical protein
VLIDEFRRCPEMPAGHGQNGEALRNQLIEHRQRCGALLQRDLSGSQLDGRG